MKKVLLLLFSLFLLFTFKVSAKEIINNYTIMDMSSKRIFSEQAKDESILPASTTKIMTLIVTIENSNPLEVVKVGNEILIADGSNIYVELGENLLNIDLMYGMILRSGNDAALTLTANNGGNLENCVKLMNEKARILGL